MHVSFQTQDQEGEGEYSPSSKEEGLLKSQREMEFLFP